MFYVYILGFISAILTAIFVFSKYGVSDEVIKEMFKKQDINNKDSNKTNIDTKDIKNTSDNNDPTYKALLLSTPNKIVRSRLELYLEIFKAIQNQPLSASEISQYTQWTMPSIRKSLDSMVKQGTIIESLTDNNKKIYKISEKGRQVQNYFNQAEIVDSIIEEEAPSSFLNNERIQSALSKSQYEIYLDGENIFRFRVLDDDGTIIAISLPYYSEEEIEKTLRPFKVRKTT